MQALKLFSDMTAPPELQRAEQTRLLREISKKLETKDTSNKQGTTQQSKTMSDVFTISIKDREIRVNNWLISKPYAVGSNFEFFEYIRSQKPNVKIERKSLPEGGGIGIKNQVKHKGFIKILNGLGFKGEILKAFFYNRGKNTLSYRGDKITKADLENAGVKISLFLKELELAHTKNSPE